MTGGKLHIFDRPAPPTVPAEAPAAPVLPQSKPLVAVAPHRDSLGGPVDGIIARAIANADQRHGLATPALATPALGAAPQAHTSATLIAAVGDVRITMQQAVAIADTPALQRRLAQVAQHFAAALHVTQEANESAEAFFERVNDAALLHDQLPALDEAMADAVDATCLQATFDLIDNATLRTAFSPAALTQLDPHMAVADVNAMLRDNLQTQLATEHHVAPDSPEAKTLTDNWLLDQQRQAMWAPYEASIDAALPSLAVQDRVAVRDQIFALYVDTYGIDTPHQIASDLTHRGSAATIVALVRATLSQSWTVGDLAIAARKDPNLARFVKQTLHGLGLEDTLLYANTQLTLKVDAHGLHVSAGKKDKSAVFSGMHAGQVHATWAKAEDGAMSLVLVAAEGTAIDRDTSARAQDDILARLKTVPAALKRAWSKTETFAKVLDETGLQAYVGDDLHALVLDTPGVRDAFKASVAADVMRGKSTQDIATTGGKMGLPAEEMAPLLALAQNVAVLRAVSAPSRELAAVMAGAADAPAVILPLDVNVPLTATQSSAVATLQTYFLAAGLTKRAPRMLGVLDSGTVEILRAYNPDENATTFTLDAGLTPRLIAALGQGVRAPAIFVGDWATAAPAMLAHRAHGGKLDPMRLVLAYLSEMGFAVALDPPRATQALIAAIVASTGMPLDNAALARAEQKAALLAVPSESDLAEFMCTKFALVATRPPRAVALDTATPTERKDLLRRIATRGQPAAERGVARGDFGLLALNEPIVALQLAIADLAGQRAPVSAEGKIDGVMPAGTLRTLRDILFPLVRATKGSANAVLDTPELYQQFTRVAEAIDRGELTLATLSEDFSTNAALGSDGNAVVATLRQMAQGLRAGTLPTSAAEAAVAAQLARCEPVARQTRPLAAAKEILGALPQAGVARLTADDIATAETMVAAAQALATSPTTEVAVAAKDFLAKWSTLAPALPALRRALRSGDITIVEQQVTSASPVLAAQGQDLLEALVAAAEITQTQRRIANRGTTGTIARGLTSALHHLGKLPGFGDDFAYNTADGWMLTALKLEMAQAGSLLLASDTQKRSTQMATVDAATLEYLIDHHAEMFGRSTLSMVSAGIPEELPSNAEAKALLADMVRKMKTGEITPWDNLDITVADTDPQVRTVKALVQSALQRMHEPAAVTGGRDGAVLGSTAARLVGVGNQETQIVIRALLVREGALDPSTVGVLEDTTLSAAVLDKSVVVARAAADKREKWDPAGATALRDAALVLAGFKGELTLDNGAHPAAAEKAVRTIVRFAASTLERDRMQVDFGALVPSSATELSIRSPLHNLVTTSGPARFTDASAKLGTATTWSEDKSADFREWAQRVRFDPEKSVQTALSSYALFHYFMPSLIAYDLSIAPAHKVYDGAREYFDATSDDERQAAKDKMWRAVTGVVDNFAMFTAFHSPIGFTQDIVHEVREGRLDVAAGKLLVTAPMMYGSARMIAHQVKQVWELGKSITYRNKPYTVVGQRVVRVDVLDRPIESLAPSRRFAASAYNKAALAKDLLLDPTSLVRTPVTAPLRALRALARKTFGLGKVKVKPLENSAAFVAELSPEQLAFLREDLQRGGWGTLEIDIEHLHLNGANEITGTHGGKSIKVSTADLRELAQTVDISGGTVSPALAKRMRLTQTGAARIAQALEPIAAQLKDLPRVVTTSDARRPPSLAELAKSSGTSVVDGVARPTASTWSVSIDGVTSEVVIPNRTLVKLIKQANTGDPHFARTVARELKGAVSDEVVQAIVRYYDNQSYTVAQLKRADRLSFGSDLGANAQQAVRERVTNVKELASRLSGKTKRVVNAVVGVFKPEDLVAKSWARTDIGDGNRLLFKWDNKGVSYRVVEMKSGDIRVRLDGEDFTKQQVGKDIIREVRANRARFGTLDPSKIETIKQLETAHAAWTKEAESGAPFTPERKASLAKLELDTRSALDGLLGDARDTLRGRLETDFIKLKFFKTSLQASMQENGLAGATVKIVKSGFKGLKGAASEPSFYLMVVYGGRDFLMDIGSVVNDDTLSRLDKFEAIVKSGAVNGVKFVGGVLLFEAAKEVAPKLVKGLEGAMTVKMLVDLPEVLGDIGDAIAGSGNALESMRAWRELGVPETMYLHMDGDSPSWAHSIPIVGSFVPYDGSNDVASLDRNQYDLVTPTTQYWYFDGGTLHDRVRELCPNWDHDVSPIRSPGKMKLEQVRHFREPQWRSQDYLAGVTAAFLDEPSSQMNRASREIYLAHRDDYDALPQVRSFDFKKWKAHTQAQATGAVGLLSAQDDSVSDDGVAFVKVDPLALRRLLKAQDNYEGFAYEHLPAGALVAFDKRIEDELAMVEKWSAVINSMHIPGAEKRQAMEDLIVNIASIHLANAMVVRIEQAQKPNAFDDDSHVTDAYTRAR